MLRNKCICLVYAVSDDFFFPPLPPFSFPFPSRFFFSSTKAPFFDAFLQFRAKTSLEALSNRRADGGGESPPSHCVSAYFFSSLSDFVPRATFSFGFSFRERFRSRCFPWFTRRRVPRVVGFLPSSSLSSFSFGILGTLYLPLSGPLFPAGRGVRNLSRLFPPPLFRSYLFSLGGISDLIVRSAPPALPPGQTCGR